MVLKNGCNKKWLPKDTKLLEELIKSGECEWDERPSRVRVQHPEFTKYNIQQFKNKWNFVKRCILKSKSTLENLCMHGYTFLNL